MFSDIIWGYSTFIGPKYIRTLLTLATRYTCKAVPKQAQHQNICLEFQRVVLVVGLCSGVT